MKILDISVPITSSMHIWPTIGDINFNKLRDINKGGSSTISEIKLNTHTGTHIDAPAHMLKNNKITIEQIPLDILIGKTQVICIENKEKITKEEIINKLKPDIKKILFKTKNSERWDEEKFFTDYIYLSIDAAYLLIKKQIELIGIDYLSIDQYKDKEHPVHKMLLSKNIVILEGVNLKNIIPGVYTLVCLPLKITGCDGSPARAILLH